MSIASENTVTTKLVFFGNEFPTDDLKSLVRGLFLHSKDRRFRQLATFLEESTQVLRKEVAKLPASLKKLVPHFDTILPLIDVDFRQGPLGAAMESALLVVLELGMFIGYVVCLAISRLMTNRNILDTTRPRSVLGISLHTAPPWLA